MSSEVVRRCGEGPLGHLGQVTSEVVFVFNILLH